MKKNLSVVMMAGALMMGLSGVSASAQDVNAGKAQLAAQARVNAQDFTIPELTNLRAAQIRNDQQAIDFYMRHDDRRVVNIDVVTHTHDD